MSFSCTSAHHQSGIAEIVIQQTTLWARVMLLHALIMWLDHTKIDLWPFALSHAAYLRKHITKHDSSLSPLNLFSVWSHPILILHNCKVFGCPVFVLDPRLQDGPKIPKWQPFYHLGQFLGCSNLHASMIGLILNPETHYKFHVGFDELFLQRPILLAKELEDSIWPQL